MTNIYQGEVYIRESEDDFNFFENGITNSSFNIAFPTKYSDSADGTELTGSASGEYTNSRGIKTNPYSETAFSLSLTNLTALQKSLLRSLVGKSVDICIKNSINGKYNLGNGEIFRGYNLHSAKNRTFGGIKTFVITVGRKFPANKESKINQHFYIGYSLFYLPIKTLTIPATNTEMFKLPITELEVS